MLIAATAPSLATKRLTRAGSLSAIRSILAIFPGVSCDVSSSRSSTSKSSASASVCWKLVIESTLIEYGVCQAASVICLSSVSISALNTVPSAGATPIKILSVLLNSSCICSNACNCGFCSEKKIRKSPRNASLLIPALISITSNAVPNRTCHGCAKTQLNQRCLICCSKTCFVNPANSLG